MTVKPHNQPASQRKRRLHILITAGPTREYFDSVRFISNPSSGKMGYAIAEAAASAGHQVTLVSGPVSLKPPKRVKTIQVETAAEMAAASKRIFPSVDAVVFVAAVCDYRPKRRATRKTAKQLRSKSITLVLTEDIAAALGKRKNRQITVAFAMEDHAARAHAEAKLRRKNCDAIVLNGPENVGADRVSVEFLTRNSKWERWPSASKYQVAKRLTRRLEQIVAKRNESAGADA